MPVQAAVTAMDGETFWWASLDGETWLPVNQPPRPEDDETVARLFEGDGNMKPIVFTRRWLEHESANFLTQEGQRNRRVAWEIGQHLTA